MNQAHTTAQGMACVRSRTSQVITTVATTNGEPRHEVYNRIYARLLALYGVDLYAYPRSKGESLLSVAERFDVIDKVYALAYAEHLYLQSYEE